MLQFRLWKTLVPLLSALHAGKPTMSPCSGVHFHHLCLIICWLGQHSVAGNCLQCPGGFYCLGSRTALCSCSSRTYGTLPRPTQTKDHQVTAIVSQPCLHPPGQESSLQYTDCDFFFLGFFFIDIGLSCQLCCTVLSQCLKSPAGHLCPEGTTEPTPCQPKRCSHLPGQDEATDCVPCLAVWASTQAWLRWPDKKYTPGTFSNRSGIFDLSQCETGTAGLACPRGTRSPEQPLTSCPAGHYCPPGTSQLTQFQCPVGNTWSNQTGLAMGKECIPCPKGWFCISGAQTPSGICKAGYSYPKGEWCRDCPGNVTGSKWSTQFPCPAGTHSSQTGNGRMEDCLPCPPGAFCSSGSPKPVLCPWGTFCQSPGAKLACVLCPAGHYCPELGTATPQPCRPGSFLGPGLLWCQKCLGGNICNQTKPASPTACPPGHYWPEWGLQPIPCPTGTFREAPGATRVEDCQLCLPGAFCGRAGLTEPQGLCHAGHHCGPGSNTSTPEGLPFGDICPPGYFCLAGTEDPRQSPCPVGTWNAEKGAPDASWCLPCPPGLFCAVAGQAAPTGPCAPGFYCPGGAKIPTPFGRQHGDLGPESQPCPEGSPVAMVGQDGQHSGNTGHKATHPDGGICAAVGGPCPPGHFCPVATGLPHPCPVGTFSDRMFLSNASECLSCPPGHFCASSGLTAPSGPCHPGYFCLTGAASSAPTGHLDQGGTCPVGHFCPQGTSLPQPCPAGFYNNLTGQASCFPCPAGYYCPESSANYSGHTCPAGFYCPRGTKYATQFPCPRGYYNPDPLAQSLDSCLPCSPGHYCGQENLTRASGPCDAGWFCVLAAWTARPFDLDNYTSTNCLCPATVTGGKCPAGSFCPEGSPEPLPCLPGSFCATSDCRETCGRDLSSGLADQPQPSASLVPSPTTSEAWVEAGTQYRLSPKTGVCLGPRLVPVLPDNPDWSQNHAPLWPPLPRLAHFLPSGLSTPSGPCQAGYFCAEGAVSPAPEDGLTGSPCPPGTFCPAASQRPTPCPAGTFSSLPEQKASSVCRPCPRGFYCKEAGLWAPSGQCPAGYYCDSSMGPVLDFSLYPCPQGYYCPLGTAVATHHSCPVGTYSPRRGLRSITECQLCPAGKFCALEGLTAPTGNCAAGHWCKGGATRRDPTDGARGLLCPAGHYCLEGAPAPSRCPPGTWSEEGSRTPAGCQDCSGGQLCSGHPLIWPAPYYPGISCTEETLSASPTEALSGRSCPRGHICPLGMPDSIACPPGSYTLGTHTTKCRICPSGHYCVPGLRPALCPRGFYCPEGTGLDWQPCPPGTYGPVLGLSSLPGCRACDGGRFCPRTNATEAGGQCWEGFFCSRGSTRPNPEAGTEEGAGPCPQGHFCPRGSAMPQPCPPGTFSTRIKLSSEAACSLCPPGYYCGAAGLSSPSGPCSPGFFCLGGALVPNSSLEDQNGGPCPEGHFCPPGTATPRPCPAGTYNDLAARGHCEPCPEGFFCPVSTSSLEGSECPAGHYCPAATASAAQFPCPRGTYRPQRRGTRASDCIPCEPGSYCLLPGLAAVSGPCSAGFHCMRGASVPNPTDGITGDLCPLGHFCPQGSPRPIPCPSGSLQPIPGAASLEDCQPCPAGWFCSRAGLSSPEALCEGGWFCPQASVSGHSPGSLCPPGHSCPPGSLEPQLCPPGQYQNEPGQSHCKTCPAGKFCPFSTHGPGASPIWPVDCPAGYYCPLGTQDPSQHPCPRGTFREKPGARSTKDCRPCPAGQFCSDSSSGKRLPDGPCSAGYYCPPGQTSAKPPPFRCPHGFYCPVGSPQPKACENGTFQPQEAQSFCEPCPAGFYCRASSTGFLSATAHPCPRGTFGPRTGAATELDCELCPAGMFCSSEGLAQPSGLCRAAHYCAGGAVSPTPIKHKVEALGLSGNDICPPGFFCPEGTSSPVPCPPGFYSSIPGLVSQDQCQPCPPGHYCSRAGLSHILEAELCHAGYICLGGSPVPAPSDGTHGYRCPPGFRCPPGAPQELPCEPGSFSPLPGADTCLPCPGGTFCPRPATVEPTICPKGHYCPVGTAFVPPSTEGTMSTEEGTFSPRICQFCPAGQHCPGEGDGQPEGGMSEGDCVPCPGGTCCPRLGLTLPTSACVSDPECSSDPRVSSPTARPCPQGHFCQPGAAWPAPCQRGEYQPSLGSDTCLLCPPGFHCPDPGTPVPKLCPAHAYCPAGTWSPPLCPPGTFTSQDASGLQAEDDCSICPPGHYCRGGQIWGKCPAGYFCPPGTSGLMTPCPPRQRCALQCPPGFYCPEGSEEPTLCPPHTTAAAPGAKQQDDCEPCPPGRWCKAGDPASSLCPAGHYCPGGGQTHLGSPKPCPKHTYLPMEGGQSQAECLPCPAGYHCPSAGLTSFEGYPCPPGHWCPGAQGAFLCPPGTFRAEPGASSLKDCELCPPGYYCPLAELSIHANVFAIPCRAGTECPAGAVAEVKCRAGSYCRPRTGIPLPCPGGYACPEGSSSYAGRGQLCLFPYYCPPGSAYPLACPGGSEAVNVSGLRVSEETCCRLCEAGTYRSQTLDAMPCQPCPPGFSCHWGTETYHHQPCPIGHYCPAGTRSPKPCPSGTFQSSSGAGAERQCLPCPAGTFSALPGQAGCLPCGNSAFSPPGASDCTCWGLNRVFQKSDSSCICLAGHESYDKRDLENDESNSDEDCQPQVAERCWPGDIRLAATRRCVSPQQHNCSIFCHPEDGELNAQLGICQCRGYVAAEELCDAQCLAKAPHISLAWSPSRTLILSVKGKTGDGVQMELADTLGPDQFFQGHARVHLVQCGPNGISGFVISRMDMLDSFLLGTPVSSPLLPRHRQAAGPQNDTTHSHIPNPVVCLLEGDVVLFQLHILPHNRSASHYPVYQKQHLFNSNAQWDFGAFRRLGHLVRETHLNFSRFAHQFLDPGTYVFRDNGLPESVAVVLVKKGVACDPGLSPMQPSSPYQLIRHGILRQRLPNLGPDWVIITGVLLTVGLATMMLMGLGIMLRPPSAQACPMKEWKSQWRGLGETHMLTEYLSLRESFPIYEDLDSQSSGEGNESMEKSIGSGEPFLSKPLEDLSVRTLYDKLEDQSLHVAAQLSQHRRDALAFYRGTSQQLQGLKELLQDLSPTERQVQGRNGDLEMKARAATRTRVGQSEGCWGDHSAASQWEFWPYPRDATVLECPLGFQSELDKVTAALASALSHALKPPAGVSKVASAQISEWLPSVCQQDPHLRSDLILNPPPLLSYEESQSTSSHQERGPEQPFQGDNKGDAEDSGSQEWTTWAAPGYRAFPELQRKIQQVEDTLDELNEEFFQLSAQALKLQKEAKPGQPAPTDGDTMLREELDSDKKTPGAWTMLGDQALALEVRRVHLVERISDLEWELSLLLQVSDIRMQTGGCMLSLGDH